MNSVHAQNVLESLRLGIPPESDIEQFTVGRSSEIGTLKSRLIDGKAGALLLQANYGCGKTHLLKLIRELALGRGFAVSLVTLDARSAVRFNRLDQVFGAICRNIEIPKCPEEKGIRCLFNLVCSEIEREKSNGATDSFWHELTNGWQWDLSDILDSPAMFVALRAWGTGNQTAGDLVEDLLFQPWDYRARRKYLHVELVEKLRRHFRDPRPEWKFYSDDVFGFHQRGHSQSWAGLRDLNTLATAAGLQGLVLLFDEFEDVITNLNNVAHQEAAFWNLFQFYSGKDYPGMTFYAVTPEFTDKCKRQLLQKGRWDFDYSRFELLPTFQMSPLAEDNLIELACTILQTHGIAYGWDISSALEGERASELATVVRRAAAIPVQDRTRITIKQVVEFADNLFEDIE